MSDMVTTAISERTGRYCWAIIALLFFATTVNYIDCTMLGLLAPTLQTELNRNKDDYGNIVSYDTSGDGGKTWQRFDRGMAVSGYHHNVRGGFLMLRPDLYAAGPGEGKIRNFRFTALED